MWLSSLVEKYNHFSTSEDNHVSTGNKSIFVLFIIQQKNVFTGRIDRAVNKNISTVQSIRVSNIAKER